MTPPALLRLAERIDRRGLNMGVAKQRPGRADAVALLHQYAPQNCDAARGWRRAC